MAKKRKKIKKKTKKAILKRFRITKTGKVLHQPSFGRHLKRRKNRKRLRRLKKVKPIGGKIAKKIKKILE